MISFRGNGGRNPSCTVTQKKKEIGGVLNPNLENQHADGSFTPTSIKIMFDSVETTVIISTGSEISVMPVDTYEKIKALPTAKDVIRRERKSRWKYQSDVFGLSKQKIINEVDFNACIDGIPLVIKVQIVPLLVADAILGQDFIIYYKGSFNFKANAFKWEQRDQKNITFFLKNPVFRAKRFICGITAI